VAPQIQLIDLGSALNFPLAKKKTFASTRHVTRDPNTPKLHSKTRRKTCGCASLLQKKIVGEEAIKKEKEKR